MHEDQNLIDFLVKLKNLIKEYQAKGVDRKYMSKLLAFYSNILDNRLDQG